MSTSAGTGASREAEITFLAMEQVLGVDIWLADAGTGDSMPDGSWSSPDGQGIVEVTTRPATRQMAVWARAKRAGEPLSENGSVPARLNELADFCMELLETDWAMQNIMKLRAQPAEQRHLFLSARTEDIGDYFNRLSDEYDDGPMESIGEIALPSCTSDVWFQGQAQRCIDNPHRKMSIWIARYQKDTGWQRHVVDIDELALPSPNPGLVDDRVPAGQREPKHRT